MFTELKDAHVLVVDDNQVNRHLLQALLERGGISHIDLALDGEDALRHIGERKPDLILLDLMMPNLDGFEFCRRLRADSSMGDVPVLVQSSLNRAEDRARAFNAGATDYVSKPINAVELLSRVRIHLQNRMLLNRLQIYRQRTEAELALARKMQEKLMPPAAQLRRLREKAGLGVAAHFAPSSELGGDFWGMRFDERGQLVVWIVDFSGHGVGAALNTFRLHAILNQLEITAFNPSAFLALLNQRLCPLLPSGQYATMLAGVVDQDSNQFRYASAGATRPLVWSAAARTLQAGDNSGIPLGILRSAQYELRSLPLHRGDRLFLYSDAATELPVDGGILDESGLEAILLAAIDIPEAEDLLAQVLAALSAYGSFDDDLTTLVIQRER